MATMIDKKALGYKEQVFVPRPVPNYTPPGKPSIVDIFKGDDGDGLIFKTYVMTKYTTLATFLGVSFDATVGTRPKDLAGLLRRVGYWSVPIIGGGIAYTSMVSVAASIRKKDDQWNHVIGGIGAGTVCGGARRSIMFGVFMSAVLAFVGASYKESIMFEFEIFKETRNIKRGFANSHLWDLSLRHKTEPERGNWYKDKTPMPPPAPTREEFDKVSRLDPVC